MVAVKQLPSTRSNLEVRGRKFHLDYKESKPPGTFAGFIFLCSNETFPDLESRVFGLPLAHLSSVRAIKLGMPLFLFNYSTRCLCGVYEAASDGGLNLDPWAWQNIEVRKLGKPPVSRYPAQVRVNLKFKCSPLDEEIFRPVLDLVDGHKFRLELRVDQVKQLLNLFSVPEESFGDRSKKWMQSTGIGTYLPDSPHSTFKSDSDCYSECSSRGTYCVEDDWIEDEKAGKTGSQMYLAYGNSEPYLNYELSQLSLNDAGSTKCELIDENPEDNLQPDVCAPSGMPFLLHGSDAVASYRQQSAAKNSNPVSASDTRASQFEIEKEAESSPYIPVCIPSPYLGCKVCVSVPTQPRRSEQKKLAASALSSRQGHNLEKHGMVSNFRPQKSSQQQYPVYLQGPQDGHVLQPVPGSVHDSNHAAIVLPPLLLSPFGQGFSLVHPQFNGVDQIEQGQAAMNIPQMHAGRYQNFYGQLPVLLLPRVPPSLPLFAGGFAEELHINILQFTRLTRPSVERQLFEEAAIDSIRSCVRTVWPDADVEVFGSFATGLCLQHSDVDLAIVNAPLLPSLANMTTSQASSFLLRELGLSLKASKCCDSYKVIANASVPVLKCYCRPIVNISDPSFWVPSVAMDITVGAIKDSNYEWDDGLGDPHVRRLGYQQHMGGAARQYVLGKIRELPALAPLVLLLKSFLHHRGLSNVYLGGLGSFSLTLLVAFYLEGAPLSDVPSTEIIDDDIFSSYKCDRANRSLGEYYVRKAANAIEKVLSFWDVVVEASLGKLLLGFLLTFGFERDLAREKIVLKGMDGSPGGIFKRDSKHIAVWIDDPLRPGVNIAAGSFGIRGVQAAFKEMHCALLSGQLLTTPLHCDEQHCQDLDVFGQLSRLSWLLIDGGDHYEKE